MTAATHDHDRIAELAHSYVLGLATDAEVATLQAAIDADPSLVDLLVQSAALEQGLRRQGPRLAESVSAPAAAPIPFARPLLVAGLVAAAALVAVLVNQPGSPVADPVVDQPLVVTAPSQIERRLSLRVEGSATPVATAVRGAAAVQRQADRSVSIRPRSDRGPVLISFLPIHPKPREH